MAWAKVDDDAPMHPKIVAAGIAAWGLFVAGLCYSNHYLTDGLIAARALPAVFPGERPATLTRLAAKLVEVRLWEPREDGWAIHDFHCYQPTRAEVVADRTRSHEAKVKGGQVRASAAGRIKGRFVAGLTANTPAAHQQAAGDVVAISGHQSALPSPAGHQQATSPVPVPVPEVDTSPESKPVDNGGYVNGHVTEQPGGLLSQPDSEQLSTEEDDAAIHVLARAMGITPAEARARRTAARLRS